MICSPKLNRQLRYSAAVAVLGAVVAGVALFLISFIFAIAQTNDVYPPVISGVMADNITAFSAQIKWGTDEPSDSRVAYGTASGQYPYGSDNRCDGGGMVTQHCVYLGGLQSGTVYYYRVMSMDGSLNEAVSPGHQFTTVSESSGGTNIPAAPSNLRLDPPSSTSAIYLKWTDNADNEDKFNVQRALAGSGSWSFSIQLEGSNLIAYSDSSVVFGTLYDYRVQACRSGYGCSAYAYLYNVKTASDTTPAGSAPTVDVKVNNVDGTISPVAPASYTVSWTTTESPTTCVPEGAWFGSGDKTVPSGSWQFSSVTVLGLKTYTLTCSNAYGYASDTVYVDVVSGTTDGGGGGGTSTNIPNAPSNLRLDPPSSTSAIYLKWTDNADNEDKFNVQRALAGSGSWSFSIQLEGSNLIAYSDSSVVSGTLYDYRVQACRSGYGCSAYAYLYNVKTASDTSVQIAHATAKGTVLDSNNLAIAGAVVHIFSKDTGVSVSQTTLSDGTFNFSVPAGNYTAEFFPPHNRTDLAKPSPISFSVQSGETKSLTVKFSVPTKVISGRAQFSNGIAVTDANISVYNSVSGQSMRIKTDSNGNYQFKAGPGKWIVNILPVEPSAAKWRAEGFGQEAIFSEDATAENRILNFPVSSALSKVMVTTVDQNNAPVSDAGVVLDAAGVIQTSVTQNIFREWRKSDGSGLAHFFAPQGVYFIRAFLPSESGFINPEEQKIEIGSAQDKSVKIVFRKKETITTVEITGKVKLDDGRPVDAVVWGWSQKGLSVETRANSSGEFRFTIPPNDRWSFGAGKEVGGFPYKSNQIIIDVFNAPVAIHLVLKRFGETALAPSVSVEQSATQKIIAQTQDGAKVTVPPSATAQTGNVSVDIKPTIEAPSQAASKVVSTVYEITVRDQVGQQIKQLQEEIEIVLPYDLNQLKAQGVTEDTIVPSFFDETTGTWVKLDNFIVDKEKKVIVAKVKHLTRFAIVAAADVVPPSPPTNVVAANLSGGSVRLSWLNPIADFHHAKIYRSTVQGELGSVIYHEVIGNSAVDGKGLVNGVAYYYLIRAVDSAGNESTNTTQITVVAVGTSSAVGTFAKNLRFGDKNDDVKALQEFLITEGVYPEALVTGYFGLLTRAAAIKFQEKYRADILTPLGLTDGTGFVGPSTRVKINAILSN